MPPVAIGANVVVGTGGVTRLSEPVGSVLGDPPPVENCEADTVTFQPLSDFALHDMGTGLADGVSQGDANGREFRTAPLWGLGQRTFFLHDGRTNNLAEVIQQHSSNGSEANQVIRNYNLLSTDDKQALLNYLRSL